jgi:hypothetical protein
MKLERGKVYIVKHSSGMIRARFSHEVERGGYGGSRIRRHFVFENLGTGRSIELKSLVKVKREAESPNPTVSL